MMMQDFLFSLSQAELISYIGMIGAIITAVLSLIQSWLNNKKLSQLEKEKFSAKISLDFSSEFLVTNTGKKLVKGIVKLKNDSLTNIKIVKLNIDGKDRTTEYEKAYISTSLDDRFVPLDEKLEQINVVGFNNSKQIRLEVPHDKYFQLLISETPYLHKVHTTDKKMYTTDVYDNITLFITKVMAEIKNFYRNIDNEHVYTEFERYLFQELLVKNIRGLQLFSGEQTTQEFLLEYKQSGFLTINVEVSSLRVLLKSISSNEDFKNLANKILNKEQPLDTKTEQKLLEILHRCLDPPSDEIIDQRRTFLLYLP